MKEVCLKCDHRETCKTPCLPVKLYLAQDNLTVFEKTYTNEDGETTTILYSRSRETPESMLTKRQDPGFTPEEVARAFSTENGSPFAHFDPKLKQTGIFIDRFFHNFTYEDLAVKYDTTRRWATHIYHAAEKRLLAVLEQMDLAEQGKKRVQIAKQVKARSGTIPKGQKWFLLNKLFDMMPSDIAKMEGIEGSSAVRQLIIRVSDQLRAGEIRLMEFDPEEATQAKQRLDAQRAKRRDRRNK